MDVFINQTDGLEPPMVASYHECDDRANGRYLSHADRPRRGEAIAIVWRQQGHSEDLIPANDALNILAEVRARKEQIEAKVQKDLLRAIGENRRYPRRHQLLAFYLIAAIAALACAGLYLADYVRR